MSASLPEEIEQAVAALRWTEENPTVPDDRFERCWTAIAARAADALEPLKVLLTDPDPGRRATAGYLLGRVGEAHESLRAEVRAALLTVAPGETDDRVIQALAAGASLASLDNGEALALLRAAEVNLRRVAAYHLGMVVSDDEDDELIRDALRTIALS